jgi:hypothetical protein
MKGKFKEQKSLSINVFHRKNSLILKLLFFMSKISVNDNFLSLSVEYDNLSLLSNQELKNKKNKLLY